MSSKILSICIPSYNMEKYLNRCVESLLAHDVLNDIEIMIVNDGSKDNTLEIANEYKAKYPASVVVVDKPNGHYGSTVNAALKVATGKYFRILDADDWFDTNSLIIVVNKLKEIDTDCVFTRFITHDFNISAVIEQNVDGVIFDKELMLDKYIIPTPCYAMHSFTYKVEHLKSIGYTQTEGICYTDTEYIFYPLRCAKSIYNIDASLYQYYVGRDDQSMSHSVLSRNFTHFEKLFHRFMKDYTVGASGNVENIQNHYIYEMAFRMLNINILYNKYDKRSDNMLRKYMISIKDLSDKIYSQLFNNKTKRKLLFNIWIKYPRISKYILLPAKFYFLIKR